MLHAGFMEQLLAGGPGASGGGGGDIGAQTVEASFRAVWGELPEARRDGVGPGEALQKVCAC